MFWAAAGHAIQMNERSYVLLHIHMIWSKFERPPLAPQNRGQKKGLVSHRHQSEDVRIRVHTGVYYLLRWASNDKIEFDFTYLDIDARNNLIETTVISKLFRPASA